ncbi:MAG: DJ-1/PfpI family protein [Acidobacteria bacterium]|nr:DJ-1/PfpI family protein [Acidobacteriota bacterium]
MRIGIFLFPECEELDWAGPWEVLTTWARLRPDHDVEVFTLARDNVAATSSLMTSVCTGSLVFAAAGLLDHRPATTHWGAIPELEALAAGREIEIRPDDRFVDDGEVITAAGVSAGIDMALHLITRLGSVDEAKRVRRTIQYDPEPPV